MKTLIRLAGLKMAALTLSGCLAATAVSVVGDVAEGAVNAGGAVVGAAIPDGDDEDDD